MTNTTRWTTAAQASANPRYVVRPATPPRHGGMTLVPDARLRTRGALRLEVGAPGGSRFEQGPIRGVGRMNGTTSPVTKSDAVRFATPPVPGTRSWRPPA